MRILDQKYPSVKLVPETLVDLWYLEKVIDPGNLVSSQTMRKWKTETGETVSKKVWIKIRVERVEFQRFSNSLRVLGKIVEGRPEEYISYGSHHTLEVKPGIAITLEKAKWLPYHKDMIKKAIKASKRPKFLLVSMDFDSALIYALTEVGLDKLGEFKATGMEHGEEDSARINFWHNVARALQKGNERIVLGGPGFPKDEFVDFCKDRYPDVAKRIIVADTNSAGYSGIKEMLTRPETGKALEETRISEETKLVEKLMEEIAKGENAVYGLTEVEQALDFGAVENLLISESFFSEKRDLCESLMEKAYSTRSSIHIIGEDHDAGKQLEAIGGIAAILRFKIS